MHKTIIHGIALFSGGLDSLLAAKILVKQGLNIHCLHAVSPFFGKPQAIPHWQSIYGLSIEPIDISAEFVSLLRQKPKYGFGKVMNPCVDCKILMMRLAHTKMKELGASFIISGEVIGQRPMSQRKDMLNFIPKHAEIYDILLRPLSAKHLPPTEPEHSGLVDRSKLLGFFGRGRKAQIALAKQMGIKEIPTPAGGCRLTEKDSVHRYWSVLTKLSAPSSKDFFLANVGRQYWHKDHWLIIGRNEEENTKLEQLACSLDLLIKIKDFPGPLGLVRQFVPWESSIIHNAAALVASYAPKAMKETKNITITILSLKETYEIIVQPTRTSLFSWKTIQFEDLREAIKQDVQLTV